MTTLQTILANPRYTGREVWNRRQTVHGAGRGTVTGEVVMSEFVAHPALVTEQDFVATQQVRADRATVDGRTRRYLLRGLLRCGQCGRRMDAHWVHQRAGYRCRHGYRSTTSRPSGAPENVYVREDQVLRRIALDLGPQAGLKSIQEIADFLSSNNMVVEVYGPDRWAVTGNV